MTRLVGNGDFSAGPKMCGEERLIGISMHVWCIRTAWPKMCEEDWPRNGDNGVTVGWLFVDVHNLRTRL